MKRYLIWILMLLPLAAIGQWVDPVSFFHFDQFGDDLTQSEMEKIMWDKGYHITGMKLDEWQTLGGCTNKVIRNHWKEGGGVVIEDQATHTLYIDTPASISIVVEKEWRNIFNDYESDEICKEGYKFVANNLKFSFDETNHSYSFSYTPAGSYSYTCANSNTGYGSTDETFMTFGYVKGDAIGECNGVWVCFLNDLYNPNDSYGDGHDRHYMIFWLDKVMLDPPIKAKDMPKPSSVAHENFVEDQGVSFWGDNDEHATAMESAVVNVVGTLLALLLGGLAGGAGGAIPLDPPVSSTVPPTGSTSPVDPTKFNPTNYPDYSDKFITQQPDGDLVVRDPVTGKETLYINNGDGTYRNFNTNQDWTPDEINEQLRYRDENSSLLQQDAETAACNVAEQHAAWEAQNARDLERGYSDEQKEFMDWKQEQEDQLKHEEYLDKMALKYHVPPTDKAVMDAIRLEQTMNQIEADTYIDYANQYDQGIKVLETVDKVCESGVNILGGVVPGANTVKNVYTFAKSTLVAASESVAEGKSFGEGVAHVLVGMADGALGVIQNEAGELTKDVGGTLQKWGVKVNEAGEWAKATLLNGVNAKNVKRAGELVKGIMNVTGEWGINVFTEDLKEGMKAIAEGKSIEDVGKTMITTTGQKTAEYGAGKLLSGLLGWAFKDEAKPTMVGKKGWLGASNKTDKLHYWINKETPSIGIGERANVYKVTVKDLDLTEPVNSLGKIGSFDAKGQGFSRFFSGKITTEQLTENIINEFSSRTGITDEIKGFGGNKANWVNDTAAGIEGTVAYGVGAAGKALVDFGGKITQIDTLATNYRKS